MAASWAVGLALDCSARSAAAASAQNSASGRGASPFGATGAPVASQFTLYIESKAARDGLPAALSGRYVTPQPNVHGDGILGQQLGSTITLALLANQLSGDTVDVFTGELRGDTLSGTFRKAGTASVFVRSP